MMASVAHTACALILFLGFSGYTQGFVPSSTTSGCHSKNAWTSRSSRSNFIATSKKAASSSEDVVAEATESTPAESLRVPLSWGEMVRQAAAAMKKAQANGQTRQIVRVLLPRDSTSGDLGKYLEATPEDLELSMLVPPDESWQGGIMQLYRVLGPTCSAILRQATQGNAGVPSRILEDRSVDESGVDGVGLFTTEDGELTCWAQPMQENVDALVKSAQSVAADKTVLLLNPQWRTVDDALDSASQGEGFLSGLASFLGGKGQVLKAIDEQGFRPVYTLEGYVCRGSNVRLLQVLDSEWAIFCENEDGESFTSVGVSPTRPSYQDVDQMLQDADIGFKFYKDLNK